jgi:hypothetical protein
MTVISVAKAAQVATETWELPKGIVISYFGRQVELRAWLPDFLPNKPKYGARVYLIQQGDQRVVLVARHREFSSWLQVQRGWQMEVARCKAGQIQRTELVRESYVTSKQTQPNAYTSVVGVRANAHPKRSGSINSGAIQ